MGTDRAGCQGRDDRPEVRWLDVDQVRRHRRSRQRPPAAGHAAARHQPAVGPPGRRPDGLSPPSLHATTSTLLAQVATRFRGRVAAYQIWNEPNLDSEWGIGRLIRPSTRSAARRRRADSAVDPNAQVVMAALAPTLTENDRRAERVALSAQLYDAGVRGTFDVLAVQAYGLRGGPDDPRIDVTDVTFSRPTLVRQVMVANGDASAPVWATEMGWNVNPPDFPVAAVRAGDALAAGALYGARLRARARSSGRGSRLGLSGSGSGRTLRTGPGLVLVSRWPIRTFLFSRFFTLFGTRPSLRLAVTRCRRLSLTCACDPRSSHSCLLVSSGAPRERGVFWRRAAASGAGRGAAVHHGLQL